MTFFSSSLKTSSFVHPLPSTENCSTCHMVFSIAEPRKDGSHKSCVDHTSNRDQKLLEELVSIFH